MENISVYIGKEVPENIGLKLVIKPCELNVYNLILGLGVIDFILNSNSKYTSVSICITDEVYKNSISIETVILFRMKRRYNSVMVDKAIMTYMDTKEHMMHVIDKRINIDNVKECIELVYEFLDSIKNNREAVYV